MKPKRIQTRRAINFSQETRDAIKRIADERDVPMSRVVEDAIAALVAQGKP